MYERSGHEFRSISRTVLLLDMYPTWLPMRHRSPLVLLAVDTRRYE